MHGHFLEYRFPVYYNTSVFHYKVPLYNSVLFGFQLVYVDQYKFGAKVVCQKFCASPLFCAIFYITKVLVYIELMQHPGLLVINCVSDNFSKPFIKGVLW